MFFLCTTLCQSWENNYNKVFSVIYIDIIGIIAKKRTSEYNYREIMFIYITGIS